MAVPDFVDAVRFVASAGGTVDFVASGAAQGYRNAAGNLTNGATYRYRAESADLSQWEIGTGTWTSASSTFARTAVLFSSTGAKVSFTAAPQVAITVQAQDLKTTQAQNDNSTNLATTQYADRIRGLPDHARLVFVSATQIKLAPYNGFRLPIAGLVYDLPSGGVTAANTSVFVNGVAAQNLAASTLYYVYLFNNGGTLTIDFSTTTHATDTASFNIGVEIKSGDNTRTLVGMVRTNASSQFADSQTQRFVRSWHNRQRVGAINAFTVSRAITSVQPTFAEINSEIRCEFVLWAGEVAGVGFSGAAFPAAVANGWIELAIAFDSTSTPETAPYMKNIMQCATTAQTSGPVAISGNKSGLSEGYHFATVLGMTNSTTGAPATDGLGAGFSSLAVMVG